MKKSSKIFLTFTLILVLVLLIISVVIVLNNKNAEWVSQTQNSEKDFQIVFNKTNDLEIKTILNGSTSSRVDYSIYTYGGDANIIINGDKSYTLKEAIISELIYADEILSQAEKDAENGVCDKESYKDGGTATYSYPSYTVIKFNRLSGDKDLYITGETTEESRPIFDLNKTLEERDQQTKEELKKLESGTDEDILENTTTEGLTPISEKNAQGIFEEYMKEINIVNLSTYYLKSITRERVKPSNYFTAGVALNIRTADFEREAYVLVYIDDRAATQEVTGYVDIYTGKVIGGGIRGD